MKQYVVDAFTDQVFDGNPAAVCLLDRWPADELLMKITRENNLSETAFAVPEDPVCGSGHCHIIPYWAEVLGQTELTAYQASPRGGVLYCRVDGDRIRMAGRAALYAVSELFVEM